jgi:2'-5' RNA ligase
MRDQVFGEMRANAFTLFRSHLRPSGAIHETVEKYPLAPEKP